jgi:hypothetical protein
MKLEPESRQWYGCIDRENQMFAVTLLVIGLGAFAGAAAAGEAAKPAPPDPAYCARRDADPEKCVIQDGPPHKPIVRKKQPQPK